MVLRRIKDKVQNKFNVAIADVGTGEYRDSWQSAQLGFAVVSNELAFTRTMVREVMEHVEALAAAKVMHDEQDYLQYGDDMGGGAATHEPELTEADFLRGGAGEHDDDRDGDSQADPEPQDTRPSIGDDRERRGEDQPE